MASGVLSCFNSTLVQLKVCAHIHGISDKLSFNSTLVQLKGSEGTFPVGLFNCFNSTLVQLKVVRSLVIGWLKNVSILP